MSYPNKETVSDHFPIGAMFKMIKSTKDPEIVVEKKEETNGNNERKRKFSALNSNNDNESRAEVKGNASKIIHELHGPEKKKRKVDKNLRELHGPFAFS